MLEAIVNQYSPTCDHVTFQDIKDRRSQYKLTISQLENILRLVSLDQLETILNRKITYITELDYNDYIKIVNVTDQFNPITGAISQDHPISYGNGYEYGWQFSDKCQDNKMFYLRFYNLMVLDFDSTNLKANDSADLDEIISITQRNQFAARIYKTPKGYHLFVTSLPIHHSHVKTVSLQYPSADPYYVAFSHKSGYKVRLSPKTCHGQQRDHYLVTVGEHEDPRLSQLMRVYDSYLQQHS